MVTFTEEILHILCSGLYFRKESSFTNVWHGPKDASVLYFIMTLLTFFRISVDLSFIIPDVDWNRFLLSFAIKVVLFCLLLKKSLRTWVYFQGDCIFWQKAKAVAWRIFWKSIPKNLKFTVKQLQFFYWSSFGPTAAASENSSCWL